MIRTPIDHEALFKQITGREMTKEDADQLRSLRLHMPGALADSPSYNFNLIFTYHQLHQLRGVVAGASEAIVDDVQQRSVTAVDRLVDDTVKRIHASSPSVQNVYWRAVRSVCLLLVVTTTIGAMGILTFIGQGWIAPNWLTEEATHKVRWADAVEERIGPGSVDWAMREGGPDKSLVEILAYIERRGTPHDPIRTLAEFQRCRAPGQAAYYRRGELMCRFQVADR